MLSRDFLLNRGFCCRIGCVNCPYIKVDMFNLDEDDTNDLSPSNFDIQRLNNMNIGDKIDSENGNWRVFRYKKDYSLFLLNSNNKHEFMSFKKLDDLIWYLNN